MGHMVGGLLTAGGERLPAADLVRQISSSAARARSWALGHVGSDHLISLMISLVLAGTRRQV